MRVWLERLRWLMLGGAALLVLVLLSFLGYARYKANRLAREWRKHAGVTITHETNGFTYSQSIKGRTVFTLHAAKALEHADGKWTLRDAELTLYSNNSTRTDQLYGSEFEYDAKAGVARAVGEVHMDLQVPESLSKPPGPPAKIRGREGRAPSAVRPEQESRSTIHVRTSGLVYMRTLGVAATQDDVEFRYGGMEAHAHGAEFDESTSTVHLLADVRLNGELHGNAVSLRAAKADLDRTENRAVLASPVVSSGDRRIGAGTAVLHMRKDGSVEAMDAAGGVDAWAGTERLHGAQLKLALNEKAQPTAGRMSGGVTLEDSAPGHAKRGSAEMMEATFDAAGQPDVVTATGGAQMSMWDATSKGVAPLERSVRGDRVVMRLAGDEGESRLRLTEVHATGHASARGEALVMAATKPLEGAKAGGQAKVGVAPKARVPAAVTPGRRMTSLAADELNAEFAESAEHRALLRHLTGTGHARLEQSATGGQRQASTADVVDVTFAAPGAGAQHVAAASAAPALHAAAGPAPANGRKQAQPAGELQVSTAVETGSVTLRTEAPRGKGQPPVVSVAAAERALYDGATQRLLLTGAAQFRQSGMAVGADAIAVDQASGDAMADHNVTATIVNRTANGTGSEEGTHAMSDHAVLQHDAQVVPFYGAEGRPARLWHEGSQVQGAVLVLDGQARTMTARPQTPGGVVSAVFVSTGEKAGAAKGQVAAAGAGTGAGARPAARVVRVSSARMEYVDRTREAVFTGNVSMRAAEGDVRAQRAVVFFRPAAATGGAPDGLTAANPAAGAIDHAVASGNVRFAEPGRSGTAEQILYTAATDTFVLTGASGREPRIVDAQQGSVTGATLVFGASDSTIIVSGAAAGPTGRRGRVRTETTVER